MSRLDFDPSQFAAAAGAAVVPAGVYEAAIIDSMKRPARSGDGDFLQLCFQIGTGEHTGRVVWVRLHVGSSNATTKHLAQEELAAICRAAGVDRLRDSSELHNRPVLITVGVRHRGGSDITNVVRAYAPVKRVPPASP